MKKITKVLSSILAIVILINVLPTNVFAYTEKKQNNSLRTNNLLLSDKELKKYRYVNIFGKEKITDFSKIERQFFDKIVDAMMLDPEAINFNRDEISYQFFNLIKKVDTRDLIVNYKSCGWTTPVAVLGFLLNGAFTAMIGGLANGGIRALIANMGEYQAKKLVRNKIIDFSKNILVRFGFSKISTTAANVAVEYIFEGVLDPGGAFARWLDSQDNNPNNCYYEPF